MAHLHAFVIDILVTDVQYLIAEMGNRLVGAVSGFSCQATSNPGTDTHVMPCSDLHLDDASV